MSSRVSTAEGLRVTMQDGRVMWYEFAPREVYQRDDEPTKAFRKRLRAWLTARGIDAGAPFQVYDNFNIWNFNGYVDPRGYGASYDL